MTKIINCNDVKGRAIQVGDRIYVRPRPFPKTLGGPIFRDDGSEVLTKGDRGRVCNITIDDKRGDYVIHYYRTSNGGQACCSPKWVSRQYGMTAAERANEGAKARAVHKSKSRAR